MRGLGACGAEWGDREANVGTKPQGEGEGWVGREAW